MGNTRHIWFEGNAARESLLQFSEAALLEHSHGSYVAARIDPDGYLGVNGSLRLKSEGGTDIFVIGIVHSYSMSGLNLLDHLKAHLKDGTIGFMDHDWPEMKLYFNNGDGVWHQVDERQPGEFSSSEEKGSDENLS